jgi:hypothetical protein
MFEQLISCNYVKYLQETALPIIKTNNSANDEIYMFIVKFLNLNKLIISDIDLLLKKQLFWRQIEIYCINTDTISKQLIKELCETFSHQFILKILDNGKYYAIEYNTERICSIINLKVYEKYSIREFIAPVTFSVDNVDILLLPPLLEVINLYKQLYNPSMADEWVNILSTIHQLEIYVDKDLKTILSDISDSKQLDTDIVEKNDDKLSKQQNLKEILLDFLNNSNYLILNHTMGPDNILGIISRNTIEFDFRIISNYLNNFVKFGITYQEKEIYIPRVNAMEKYDIYLTYNNGVTVVKKHILTIFNNLSYELINFIPRVINNNNYKIVDPITEIMFIYISLWKHIISKRIREYKKKEFNKILLEKINTLNYYKNLINISEYKENYIGIYTDANISKKIKALKAPPMVDKSSFYCFEVL